MTKWKPWEQAPYTLTAQHGTFSSRPIIETCKQFTYTEKMQLSYPQIPEYLNAMAAEISRLQKRVEELEAASACECTCHGGSCRDCRCEEENEDADK